MAGLNEDELLRSTALQNAKSILLAREQADEALRRANDALEARTAELAQSLSMMRATLESTTDGILVTDSAGNIRDFNEKLVEICRLPPDLLSSKTHDTFRKFLAGELLEPERYSARLAEIYAAWPEETSDVLRCRDGRVIERNSRIQRSNGSHAGRVWSFRDITERIHAEEIRLRIAAIVESSDDAILSKSLEGIIQTWNPGAARMFGYVATEIVGKPVIVLIPANHQHEEISILERLKRGERIDHFETVRMRKDGSLIDVSLTVSPIKDSSGRTIGASKIARDITDRKRAERAIREQAEWFSVTLGSIGDAVVTVDTRRRVTFLNPVAEKLTGWSCIEATGHFLSEVMQLLHEATRAPVANPVDSALTEGLVIGLANHTTLIRRDGSEIPIEDSAAPIKNVNNEIIGAVMVFHDVSERRDKERALAKSEERFRLLGQVVPHLLWTADPQGKIEYFNDRWYAYTGSDQTIKPSDVRTSALHPDDRESTYAAWTLAVQAGAVFEQEYRLRRQDGEYRWFVARAVPFRDDEGKIVRWYGSSTDIHQQRQTADALREEYAVTEQLNEVAKALATELDLQRVVQLITDVGTRVTRAQFGAFSYNVLDEKGEPCTLCTLSGVPRSAFEKSPMPRATQVFGPTFRDEGVTRIADVRNDSRFGQTPPYHGMPAGHPPVVSYLAVPVISRTGEVLGGLFFGHGDAGVFTERDEKLILGIAAQAGSAMNTAQLYQDEQRARAVAEQANKTKDHFLAALSHELRTPLTPVLAILNELHADESISPPLATDLETVRRNVELEARLIDDLLDLTRITRGKLALHLEEVPVLSMIENAINTCAVDIKDRRLNLVRDLHTRADQTIYADSARITQVLWNLLKNAVKFTPEGGTITIRSSIQGTAEGERLTIEVCDTGIGIEPQLVARIFDAFEQGSREVTQQFGGLGLGLAISKAIAEAHQGSVSARSEGRGHGATFVLALPLASQKNNDAASIEKTPSSDIPPLNDSAPVVRPLRILLVEDHKDSAAIISRVLRRMGHAVFHASRVAAARETAEKEIKAGGIDLVISDLGLPDGSGLDLMRELSGKHGLRGIALSGFGMESDLNDSRAAGFSRHLIKPINLAALRSAITELTATDQYA